MASGNLTQEGPNRHNRTQTRRIVSQERSRKDPLPLPNGKNAVQR